MARNREVSVQGGSALMQDLQVFGEHFYLGTYLDCDRASRCLPSLVTVGNKLQFNQVLGVSYD